MIIYKDELIAAMKYLSDDPRTIFLGQECNTFYGTMKDIPTLKTIDLPIMEDAQMGMSIGLSLEGFIPISLYTRMDFLLLSLNQLINHLDKIEELSNGEFKPKVIIRVAVGETSPLDPGPQHTQDFTNLLETNLMNVDVVRLENKYAIVPAYKKALISKRSAILIEIRDMYAK